MGQKKVATKKVAKKATKKTTSKAKTLQSELVRIQAEIKAPKNQTNTHGNFKFRSAEDITEGYKKVAGDTTLILNDEIVEIAGRFYLKATACLVLGDEQVMTTAYAREPETQSGMNAAQITGSSSSYARKYALNGLFAIDDTKDADANPAEQAKEEQTKTVLEEHQAEIDMIDDVEKLKEYWEEYKDKGLGKAFAQMVTRRKKRLQADINADA